MSLLDVTSLLNLSEVNREFYMLVQDSVLWKKLFVKTFGAGMCKITLLSNQLFLSRHVRTTS